jgi:hypothetical protein
MRTSLSTSIRGSIALTLIALLVVALASPALTQGGSRGAAGDEEGEFYGGKWPEGVPKPDTVEYNLPFEAGKSFGVMPTPGHTAPQNKYAIDWSMPTGTPVLAAADGWVMKAIESGKGTGGPTNSLILSHANGELTCYLHLRNKGVIPKLGDFVYRGEVVAWSGATGGGPPHLHFSRNDSRLMCLTVDFIEGSPGAKSQNESFDQKYAREAAIFKQARTTLTLGKTLEMWESVVKSKSGIEDLKPADDAHPKFKQMYTEIQGLTDGIDDAIQAYVDGAKAALDSGDHLEAMRRVEFGLDQLKGSDFEDTLKGLQDELKGKDDFKDVQKDFKKLEKEYKVLKKAYEADIKGDAKKAAKEYLKWVKKNKDHPAAGLVQSRADELISTLK